ncbi:serine/threonine protein kinase [Tolypothrix sp. NIES-4075]|uniref:serine/threonine protein kinase n=1 Tax=Tolypothrix sp. NIES-4075 TaxID=2005459 RepID=UPI001F1DF51B|nr:serine/threonine-protein kinase [Tolypothrix sp. NIES-4075]
MFEQLICKLQNKKIFNNGRYISQKELGHGGFGITYLVKDKNEENKLSVIKTIKILFFLEKKVKQEDINKLIDNFKREAQILQSLHPNKNIVKFVNIFEQKQKIDGKSELILPHIVMEYVEGKTLTQLLEDNKSPLREENALRYIKEICGALTIIHKSGILHRDITPNNIMVRENTNEAVLIDFGLARDFIPEIPQSQTAFTGTEGYAPPEQLARKATRGSYTDIFGLAATLYYLLTERQPPSVQFRRENEDTLIEPKKINHNISDRVNDFILWGMELESSKRPRKVEDWLAFLRLTDDEARKIRSGYKRFPHLFG